jgi:hypothetical protein
MAIQFVINLTDDGKFNCAGPLENKLLCYGLLEMAKEAVSRHGQAVVTPPTLSEMDALAERLRRGPLS